MIWAQADFYGVQSNMVAEAEALLQGLERCVADNLVCIDVEMDSLVLLQILQGIVSVPWMVVYEIRLMMQYISQMDVQLSHTFRENNAAAADCLTNMGCTEQKKLDFRCFSELPRVVKGIVKMDRIGIQNIRCKKF